MRKFLLWDHDGVLVDTERWYFVATKECLADLGVLLDQTTYLEFMAVGRSCWEIALQRGAPEDKVLGARRARDRRYQELLRTADIAASLAFVVPACPRSRARHDPLAGLPACGSCYCLGVRRSLYHMSCTSSGSCE